MPSHHDYGIDAEHFCGGTPDDDLPPQCPLCGSPKCVNFACESDDDLALNAADVPYPATIYYCTVCGRNEVDAGSGFDTCQECLARQ